MFEFILNVVLLVAGLIIIAKSSNIVVKSGAKLARMFKISEFVVGFLLIAVATSLPELAVSISAVLAGNVGISIGNLMGSNISNIALILGITAIFVPILIKKEDLHDMVTILFITSLFPIVLIATPIPSKMVGIGLILVFIVYSLNMLKKKKALISPKNGKIRGLIPKRPKKDYKQFFWLILGLGALIGGAQLVVGPAVFIAEYFGLAQSIIGATIVALGTSLPELAIAISAAKSKKFSIAIGNLIGSAMVNLGLILGLVLLISPFTISANVFFDLAIFMIVSNMMLWYFIFDKKITRMEGIASVLFYQIFIIISILVGL